MHADPRPRPPRRHWQVPTVLALGAGLGLLAAIYASRDGVPVDVPALLGGAPGRPAPAAAPAPTPAAPAAVRPPASGQVQRTLPPPQVTAPPAPLPEAPPLPSLEASDAPLREAVGQELAPPSGWEQQVVPEQVLRRCVVFVANLAEGKVERKHSPLAPPAGAFQVEGAPLRIAPSSYARYNGAVDLVTQVPPARMAALYRRYYPLLQAAYEELGERKLFHAVLVQAIDVLLAAPELVVEPVVVPHKGNLYRFADPALEGLSPAHRQMLRLGPENGRRLKVWLRQLRAEVLALS